VNLTGVSNSVNAQHYGASIAQASFAAQRQNVGVSIGDETGVRDPNANGGLTGISNSVNVQHRQDVVTLTLVSNSVNGQHYGASLAQASVAAQRQNVGVSTGDKSVVQNPD
jgi:hypothetical protein